MMSASASQLFSPNATLSNSANLALEFGVDLGERLQKAQFIPNEYDKVKELERAERKAAREKFVGPGSVKTGLPGLRRHRGTFSDFDLFPSVADTPPPRCRRCLTARPPLSRPSGPPALPLILQRHLRLTHRSLADRLYPLRRRSRSPSRHPPPTSLRPTPCGGNLTTQSFSSSASASRCLPRTQTRPGKTCTRMKAWCWGCYAVWCRSVGVGQVQVHLHSSVSAVATSEPNPNADTRNAL
mmetsp:Transcript_40396/g.94551  ORF Transcript_40396/g.94551 Transcript_40396/m.94551 type:complete len:241 (-) Transcript_40396:21-743(-)